MTMDKAQIYEEFHMKVLRYIQSQVNDYYLAEDLCSDVFVKVYDKLDSFNEKKAKLSTWIFTITRNTLIDYYRTRKVTVEVPETLTYEVEDTEDLDEQLQTLSKALEQIDERSKQIIILHYYDCLTLKEIAEKLDISYTYVKILHKKALLLLKDYFD